MTPRLAMTVFVIGALAVVWYVWPTETRAVHTRIATLVDALDAHANEADFARIARAATLASSITPDIVVSLDDGRRLEGREVVLGVARQVMQAQGDVRVELSDLRVEIGPDRTTAVADATLHVDEASYHDARLRLVKQDGTWLVHRVDVQQPLVRPGASR